MKHIIFVIAMFVAFGANAQSYVQNGKTFEQQKKERKVTEKVEPIKTQYTWKDTKGIEYDIYMNSKTGACFVKKISSRTGNEYNQYLDATISEKIAKEYNITYVHKKREKKEENE